MPIAFQPDDSGETLAQIYARNRALFPTGLTSAEIRELDAALRRSSVFSACTTNAEYVQAIKDMTDGLLAGDFNEATARAKLQDVLDYLGYTPDKGFPGDEEQGIKPAEAGSLRDLSSEERVKLVLTTQERMAANYGLLKAGNTDAALFSFPCWELVRVYPRRVHRDDWGKRWAAAAHESGDDDALRVYADTGRMIARKDSPIWDSLGDGAGDYTDTLGNSYPPFAFGSGLGWKQVSRAEAIELGFISEDEVPETTDPKFAADLQINKDAFSPEFLDALEEELKAA